MSPTEDKGLPANTWRVLGFAAVGLLLSVMAGIGLISAGVFDPKPVGQLQAQSEPGERAVAAREERIDWVEQTYPASFTVRLTAAYERGERDLGYGLALSSPQQHLVVGVSPLGYVAVWETNSTDRTEHLPWQTWPHVALQHAPNEIQVDMRDGAVSVRLNRELLWQGQWTGAPSQIGLYMESFGGPGVIRFQDLQVYRDGS